MFLYFAALLSTASAANLCCSPDQWQADVGLIMGKVNSGAGSFTEGSMRVSYDAVNKVIAYDQNLYVADKYAVQQRIVVDAKNGMMYTIRDGMCNRTSSGEWTPYCVPDNATLVAGNSIYGLGDNAVKTNVYNFVGRGYNGYVAITADTCVPVTETVTGTSDALFRGDQNDDVMQVLTFANIKAGIADRGVFFVPAQCESTATQVNPLGRRSLYFN